MPKQEIMQYEALVITIRKLTEQAQIQVRQQQPIH